ncbi:MAG TPA: hypothetical protein VHG28_20345 [Longimicrobiaceae bacterium]|nr:hypothetical protein [Longimicrobiaceae bacterium]
MRSTRRKPALAALGILLPLVAGGVVPAQAPARIIERDGQRVEVHVGTHPGTSTAVCLESGPGVDRRKRLVVSYEGGSTRLTATSSDRGPHCAFFEPAGRSFRVRLEYSYLLVLTAVLVEEEFDREEFRGRTITFRWAAE